MDTYETDQNIQNGTCRYLYGAWYGIAFFDSTAAQHWKYAASNAYSGPALRFYLWSTLWMYCWLDRAAFEECNNGNAANVSNRDRDGI